MNCNTIMISNKLDLVCGYRQGCNKVAISQELGHVIECRES